MNKNLRPLLTLLFLLGSSGLFAQSDSTERFVLLEYGFPSIDDCAQIRASIDRKWKIYHKRVALCIVSQELEDSVRVFNVNTREQLTKAYGEDWADRYNQEFDKACAKHRIALEQSLIDTIDRQGANYVERVMNNPYFTSLIVHIIEEGGIQKKYENLSVVNLQDESNTILYRGFANRFNLNLANSRFNEFHLECVNCTIKTENYGDSIPAGEFFIKPTGRKSPILNIYSHKELLKSHHFEARNLPDPELFINDLPNGSTLPITAIDSDLNIAIRYTDEIGLKSKFEVRKWELGRKGKPLLGGLGNQIEASQLRTLADLVSGDQLQLICTVKGPDGVLRKKAAAFVLK